MGAASLAGSADSLSDEGSALLATGSADSLPAEEFSALEPELGAAEHPTANAKAHAHIVARIVDCSTRDDIITNSFPSRVGAMVPRMYLAKEEAAFRYC